MHVLVYALMFSVCLNVLIYERNYLYQRVRCLDAIDEPEVQSSVLLEIIRGQYAFRNGKGHTIVEEAVLEYRRILV